MTAGGKRAGAGRKKRIQKTIQVHFSIEPEYANELKKVVKEWRKTFFINP